MSIESILEKKQVNLSNSISQTLNSPPHVHIELCSTKEIFNVGESEAQDTLSVFHLRNGEGADLPGTKERQVLNLGEGAKKQIPTNSPSTPTILFIN